MKIKRKIELNLKQEIPVYDLTVEQTENFILENGCIVHNSHTLPSGCLHGDTEIVLSSGHLYKIKDLLKYTNINVKSHTDFREDVLEECIKIATHPRLTKRNAECIKLTLSNKRTIICTPDHRFLLKSGKWKEARFLTESDILM